MIKLVDIWQRQWHSWQNYQLVILSSKVWIQLPMEIEWKRQFLKNSNNVELENPIFDFGNWEIEFARKKYIFRKKSWLLISLIENRSFFAQNFIWLHQPFLFFKLWVWMRQATEPSRSVSIPWARTFLLFHQIVSYRKWLIFAGIY